MNTLITKAMLEKEVQSLNEALKEAGSNASFKVGHTATGSISLDEWNGRTLSRYSSGTETELFYIVQDILYGVELAS